jgi:3-hydroxyisobutyrate dehydrogenase
MRIAFVGLGNMGIPMATRLAAAGHDVRGFDLSPDARAKLDAAGGISGDDLAEVVRDSRIVVLMLPDSSVVESVVRDARFSGALRAATVIVDMSSSEPQRTRDLAVEVAAAGGRLVDAPVSGGVVRAVDGSLTIMAGGEPRDLDEVQPALTALGRVIRVGGVGSGHAVKALNNLLSASHLLLASEAIVAGERFGLDATTMLEVFNGSSGRSGSTEVKWPNYIVPGTYDSGFGLRLMLKDIRIAMGLLSQTGIESLTGDDAVAAWASAADLLESNADHTEIARWVRGDLS